MLNWSHVTLLSVIIVTNGATKAPPTTDMDTVMSVLVATMLLAAMLSVPGLRADTGTGDDFVCRDGSCGNQHFNLRYVWYYLYCTFHLFLSKLEYTSKYMFMELIRFTQQLKVGNI